MAVFSPISDFAVLVVVHGLEAHATTDRMAVPQEHFARQNRYSHTITAMTCGGFYLGSWSDSY